MSLQGREGPVPVGASGLGEPSGKRAPRPRVRSLPPGPGHLAQVPALSPPVLMTPGQLSLGLRFPS